MNFDLVSFLLGGAGGVILAAAVPKAFALGAQGWAWMRSLFKKNPED